MDKGGKKEMKKFLAIIVIFGLLLFFTMTFGWVNIKPTQVGVQVEKLQGKVLDKPLGVGYHFYNRFATDVIKYTVATRSAIPK